MEKSDMSKKNFLLPIKSFAKRFISYTIEDDCKTYRLKKTGLKVRFSLKKYYQKKWGTVPVQNNKIIFDNYMGRGYGCNGKYITEELLKTPDKYHIVWVVKDVEKNRRFFPKEIELVEYLSPESFYAYASAKIWVCNYHLVPYLDKGLQKKPEQICIQTWHGSFGIKKIEKDTKLDREQSWFYLAQKSSTLTDYWISNSSFETNVYKQAFWNVSTILEYGHPRNDIFFKNTNKTSAYLRQALGIPPETKLVLYVPTFREAEASPMEELDIPNLLHCLSAKFGGAWKFLIRLHPRFANCNAPAASPNAIDVTYYPDIQELLVMSDVVITDYSSCIFDFLLSEKPGFLYTPDIHEYEQGRGLYYPLTATPFPIAKSNKELKNCILNFDEQTYKKRIKEFLAEKGSVEDGNASQKAKALIDKIFTHF